jgi:hypothetical protein
MHFPDFSFDGNWVDVCSMATGVLYVPLQIFRRTAPVKLLSKTTAYDFANGVTLFPLFLLAAGPLSSELVKGLLEASKPTLAIAGVFALLAILEE